MIIRYGETRDGGIVKRADGEFCLFEDAQAAVKKFLTADGNDLCHENRRELAEAFGLQDIVPAPPKDRTEFLVECHKYNCSLYGEIPFEQSVNAWLKSLPENIDRDRSVSEILDGICYYCGEVTNRCYCMRDD